MISLCIQHISLFPHCFFCSASELTFLTFQQLQAVFLIYPLSHSHCTAPVVPSFPSPLQTFVSPLSPCPRGNPLLQKAAEMVQLVSPSGTSHFPQQDCLAEVLAEVFGCVFCLFVYLGDRQTDNLPVSNDSPMIHPWIFLVKRVANGEAITQCNHPVDILKSFGEPHNLTKFINFIKDKFFTAATRVSWFRWAKHLSLYFLMALVWRNKLAACLQAGIYCSVAILMKKIHMAADPLQSIIWRK